MQSLWWHCHCHMYWKLGSESKYLQPQLTSTPRLVGHCLCPTPMTHTCQCVTLRMTVETPADNVTTGLTAISSINKHFLNVAQCQKSAWPLCNRRTPWRVLSLSSMYSIYCYTTSCTLNKFSHSTLWHHNKHFTVASKLSSEQLFFFHFPHVSGKHLSGEQLFGEQLSRRIYVLPHWKTYRKLHLN